MDHVTLLIYVKLRLYKFKKRIYDSIITEIINFLYDIAFHYTSTEILFGKSYINANHKHKVFCKFYYFIVKDVLYYLKLVAYIFVKVKVLFFENPASTIFGMILHKLVWFGFADDPDRKDVSSAYNSENNSVNQQPTITCN